jgi:tetratricopeptide (TPR) repeat protein
VQNEAPSKEDVIGALGMATTRLRGRLGESLTSIDKYGVALEEATTPSLEALKSFTLGKTLVGGQKPFEAIPALKRAIELDPDFAMAHNFLSIAYHNSRQFALRDESLRQAHDLSSRATERERLNIASRYHSRVTGDLARQFETLTLLRQTYPEEADTFVTLGNYYSLLGQLDKTVEAFQEALRLRPDFTVFAMNLASAYVAVQRLDEAKALLDRWVAEKRDTAITHFILWQIASLRTDRAAADREVQWLAQRDPGLSLQIRILQAAYTGRFRDRRSLVSERMIVQTRAGLSEAVALMQIGEAILDAICGDRERARTNIAAALKLGATSRDVARDAALAMALAGLTSESRVLLTRVEGDYPVTDTLATSLYLPLTRAAISAATGDPHAALEELRKSVPYDSRNAVARHMKASAYLDAGRLKDAEAEFRRILELPRNTSFNVWEPITHLGLGRALARQGDLVASKKAYETFFDIWKDADKDVPILVAARQEYARLQ